MCLPRVFLPYSLSLHTMRVERIKNVHIRTYYEMMQSNNSLMVLSCPGKLYCGLCWRLSCMDWTNNQETKKKKLQRINSLVIRNLQESTLTFTDHFLIQRDIFGEKRCSFDCQRFITWCIIIETLHTYCLYFPPQKVHFNILSNWHNNCKHLSQKYSFFLHFKGKKNILKLKIGN